MVKEPQLFQVEGDGAVIIWKFYNPPQNLWNEDTRTEFNELLEDFHKNPDLRVGVFTSAMPDVFIRHHDVSLIVKRGEELLKEKALPPLPRRVGFRRDSKPIIAAINAPLAGSGLVMAMSFDFRFMSRTASAAFGEVNIGILPGGGGTQLMIRLIGLSRSLELMLTGRRIFADEAERIGLITRACDPFEVMPQALAFAKELAAKPPLAVHHIRQCAYEGIDMPIDDGVTIEAELMLELLKTEEALGRMRAFVAGGLQGLEERIEQEKQELERQWREKHGGSER